MFHWLQAKQQMLLLESRQQQFIPAGTFCAANAMTA